VESGAYKTLKVPGPSSKAKATYPKSVGSVGQRAWGQPAESPPPRLETRTLPTAVFFFCDDSFAKAGPLTGDAEMKYALCRTPDTENRN